MNYFLPPSVTPSGEEPIATDGRQTTTGPVTTKILPPLMTPSGEEPIAMGGWYF